MAHLREVQSEVAKGVLAALLCFIADVHPRWANLVDVERESYVIRDNHNIIVSRNVNIGGGLVDIAISDDLLEVHVIDNQSFCVVALLTPGPDVQQDLPHLELRHSLVLLSVKSNGYELVGHSELLIDVLNRCDV